MKRRTLCSWAAGTILPQVLSARGGQSPAKAVSPPDNLPGAEKNRKLKVVFLGAHVDDWCVCGGTLARYGRDGHDVLCLSLTPGDSIMMSRRLKMPLEELCAARQEHAIRGTKIIGARFKALKSQSNQKMRVDAAAYLESTRRWLPRIPMSSSECGRLSFTPIIARRPTSLSTHGCRAA